MFKQLPISSISIIVMMILVTLTSCSIITPHYNKPKITLTNNSWGDLAVESSNIDFINMPWWQKFNNKELDQLIDTALVNNVDIQKSIGNITVAKGNLQQINMNWVPTIGLGGVYGLGNTFDNSNSLNPNIAATPLSPMLNSINTNNFNFYNYGLIPSYSLNIFKQIAENDVANLNLQLAITAKNAVTMAIISQVCASYFTINTMKKQLTTANNIVSNLSQLAQDINNQYKYGLVTINDVNDIQEKLLNAKSQIIEIKNNLQLAKNSLKVLSSNNLESFTFNNSDDNFDPNQFKLKSLSSSILNNRPDVIMAEQQLKIANANIGVARSNFFPKISLTSPIGGYSAQLGDLFSGRGNFWALQIQATMPILNLGLYGIIKQAKGQYYVAYYNYVKTIENSFYDVDNNLNNMTKVEEIVALSKEQLHLSSDIAKNNQLKYKTGLISNTLNLNSLINKNNMSQLYENNKLKQIQAIIILYQSMAVGYNYNNSLKPKLFNDGHDA
jgi:multidrug efflux system outer membrane protein